MTKRKVLLYFGIILIVFSSCRENNNSSNNYSKIVKERDSLLNIVSELNNKYIFDEVKLITNAKTENTYFPGSTYELEIYFVGYNEDTYFVEYDSVFNGENIVSDTIYPDSFGILNYKKKLEKGDNKIEGFISTESKFGQVYQGVLHDVISTKKN